MPNSDQIATQLGQALGKGVMDGVWMAIVMMWGLFIAAWPAFLLLGAVAYISYRLR